jgi:hypothetical protein
LQQSKKQYRETQPQPHPYTSALSSFEPQTIRLQQSKKMVASTMVVMWPAYDNPWYFVIMVYTEVKIKSAITRLRRKKHYVYRGLAKSNESIVINPE